MGILSFLFGSDEDRLQAAVQKAKHISERINDCLTVSDGISDFEELKALVSEAKSGLKEINSICKNHPEISIGNLPAFEKKISEIEINISGWNSGISARLGFDDEVAVVRSVESYLRVVNESIEIAKTTKNKETRNSRINVASSKLAEAKGLALKYGINVSGFDIAEVELKNLSDSMGNGSLVASKLEEQVRSTNQALYEQNADLIDGLEFSATLQLRTPLRVLIHHGETHKKLKVPPPSYAFDQSEGIWIPKLKNWKDLGFDIQESPDQDLASDIGVIPDDGEYLKFLITIRKIVEKNTTIESRILDIRDFSLTGQGDEFIKMHGGIDSLIDKIFPKFLDLGPDLNTPNKISLASDEELLKIKGIGPSKLKKIRDKCAGITVGRDFDRLDNVRR